MSPRPRTTLIIAVIAQAAVSVVQFGLPAIGVDIQNAFGLGPAGFGAVFAAVGLGSAVALIPAGMLVDRFGARPVLLIGAAITSRPRSRRTPRCSPAPSSWPASARRPSPRPA